jgi:hypothetical protein
MDFDEIYKAFWMGTLGMTNENDDMKYRNILQEKDENCRKSV